VSASDFDTMGVSTIGAFGSPALIFAVVTSSMSAPPTRAAYVDEADRWCIAMEPQAHHHDEHPRRGVAPPQTH